MRYKEHDVVIEPNEIVFAHVTPNGFYQQMIRVKNVGNKSKRIQMFRPALKVILPLFIFMLSSKMVFLIGFSIDG